MRNAAAPLELALELAACVGAWRSRRRHPWPAELGLGMRAIDAPHELAAGDLVLSIEVSELFFRETC